MTNRDYQQWLVFLFDRDESKGDWRFDFANDQYQPSEFSIVQFVERMFREFNSDVQGFSDWQIATGVEYVLNNTFSDFVFALRDGTVDLDMRLTAVRSIAYLYSDCFESRCCPALGHLSESGNSLNDVCYMLWDVTPLTYCEGNPNAKPLYEAVASVMEQSLNLNNKACVESGLHGLGHLTPYYREATDIISRYLRRGEFVDKRLEKYARAALSDEIQ